MQLALNQQNAGQYREALPILQAGEEAREVTYCKGVCNGGRKDAAQQINTTTQSRGNNMSISAAAILITNIGIIFGAISTAVIWGRRIIEGVRCQLRADILQTYYKCKDTQKIRQYEAEHFDKCYHAYKALNGNSFIDEIYKKAHKWEVIT